MVKLSQFDIAAANDQSTCFAQLKDVLENLKSVATKNGLKPEDRLKDIASQEMEILGAPSLKNAIENDPNANSTYTGGGMGGSSNHSSNLLDHDPLSADMGSLAIENDPYAPSSDFISSYGSSQNNPSDDFTSSLTDYSAPLTKAPSNDLLNMNDPPAISNPPAAAPYAPPPNPPITHSSVFDMPSSEPNPHAAYRIQSSSSQHPPHIDSQLTVFDSTAGPNNRRDGATSQLSNSSYMANKPHDNFTSQAPGPSYNSWQNQQPTPSQPSWQQNQLPQQPSYQQNQPNNVANQQSWQQNQPNNNALTISSKQPSNQWSASVTAPNSYQPPQTQQKPSYNQQYPPQGGPPGQWNMGSYNQQGNRSQPPTNMPMGPPPLSMPPRGSLSNMAPTMPPNMPPGPPPPNMSQFSGSYNRQNSGNPF